MRYFSYAYLYTTVSGNKSCQFFLYFCFLRVRTRKNNKIKVKQEGIPDGGILYSVHSTTKQNWWIIN